MKHINEYHDWSEKVTTNIVEMLCSEFVKAGGRVLTEDEEDSLKDSVATAIDSDLQRIAME